MNEQKIKDESPMVYLTIGQLKEIIKVEINSVLEANQPNEKTNSSKALFILSEAATHLKMAEPTLRSYLRNEDITESRLGKR